MTTEQLAAIPGRYAQPAADTLAYLPKGGTNIPYMGHAEITLALIEVDPMWTWEPLAIIDGVPVIIKEQNRLAMWAKLTVLGKTIIGVGTCETRKGEPEKELIGDFLRNAAMRLGIGTKLWSKATSADPAGRADETGRQRSTAPREAPSAPKSADGVTDAQMKRLHATFNDRGIADRDHRLTYVAGIIGRSLESSKELSKVEAAKVIDALENGVVAA
jgi:hypothetical protein